MTVSDATRQAVRANPNDPRHGTMNGYQNIGCRCDRCRVAWRNWHRDYMHADPERLRRHAERERARRARKADAS